MAVRTSDGKVVVDLVIDSTGAVRGVRTADGEVRKFERTAGRTAGRLQQGWKRLVGTFAGVTAGIMAMRRGFRLLSESVRLAGIQQIAERKLEQALRNTGDASAESANQLKDLAKEIQRVSNFGDEAVITAQALLLSFKEVGGAQGAELLTHNLADTAAGLAKVTGEAVDLNTVAQAVGRALTQGAGALSRYGVSMTEAEKASFNAAEGIDKVIQLSEILDNNFKGLAEATVDPFKQMENAIGDAKEALGTELRAELEKMARGFTSFLQSDGFLEWIKSVGRETANVIRFFGRLKDIAVVAAETLNDLADSAMALSGAEVEAGEQSAILTAHITAMDLAAKAARAGLDAFETHLRGIAIMAQTVAMTVDYLLGRMDEVARRGNAITRLRGGVVGSDAFPQDSGGGALNPNGPLFNSSTGSSLPTISASGGSGGRIQQEVTDPLEEAIEAARELKQHLLDIEKGQYSSEDQGTGFNKDMAGIAILGPDFSTSVDEALENLYRLRDGLADGTADIEEIALDLTSIINDGMVLAISSMAEALGSGENVMDALLASLGTILTRLGEVAIATGVGLLGIKKALQTLNPFVALAAGAALVAFGKSISSQVSSIGSSIGGSYSAGSSIASSSYGGSTSAQFNQPQITIEDRSTTTIDGNLNGLIRAVDRRRDYRGQTLGK